jgi:hypothetical protein
MAPIKSLKSKTTTEVFDADSSTKIDCFTIRQARVAYPIMFLLLGGLMALLLHRTIADESQTWRLDAALRSCHPIHNFVLTNNAVNLSLDRGICYSYSSPREDPTMDKNLSPTLRLSSVLSKAWISSQSCNSSFGESSGLNFSACISRSNQMLFSFDPLFHYSTLEYFNSQSSCYDMDALIQTLEFVDATCSDGRTMLLPIACPLILILFMSMAWVFGSMLEVPETRFWRRLEPRLTTLPVLSKT